MTVLGTNPGQTFNDDDMELLSLGLLVAVAVSNARMEERQRTIFLKTLRDAREVARSATPTPRATLRGFAISRS